MTDANGSARTLVCIRRLYCDSVYLSLIGDFSYLVSGTGGRKSLHDGAVTCESKRSIHFICSNRPKLARRLVTKNTLRRAKYISNIPGQSTSVSSRYPPILSLSSVHRNRLGTAT